MFPTLSNPAERLMGRKERKERKRWRHIKRERKIPRVRESREGEKNRLLNLQLIWQS